MAFINDMNVLGESKPEKFGSFHFFNEALLFFNPKIAPE